MLQAREHNDFTSMSHGVLAIRCYTSILRSVLAVKTLTTFWLIGSLAMLVACGQPGELRHPAPETPLSN